MIEICNDCSNYSYVVFCYLNSKCLAGTLVAAVDTVSEPMAGATIQYGCLLSHWLRVVILGLVGVVEAKCCLQLFEFDELPKSARRLFIRLGINRLAGVRICR